jgi:hypothetical protein
MFTSEKGIFHIFPNTFLVIPLKAKKYIKNLLTAQLLSLARVKK